MPRFEITAPDGRKFEITGDTAPTEENLNEIFASFGGAAPAQQNADVQPEQPQPEEKEQSVFEKAGEVLDAFSGFTKETINTATFGLGDVIAGAGSALAEELFGGEDSNPAAAFNQPREEREAFREENPISSGVASFIGGFVNPAGQKAGQLITKGKGLLSTSARASGVGAGLSGAQVGGEFAGEAIGDVLEGEEVDIEKGLTDIGSAVAVGGAIGGAIPGVAGAIGGGAKGVVNFARRFTKKGQATRALRKVAEALERDGFTPQQALDRINKLGPEAALIDVGANTRALGFTAAAEPGKGKTQIVDFLRERQEGVREAGTGIVKGGQVNRIQGHIDQLVEGNFFTEQQQLANINKAAKFYDSAYSENQNIESRVIDRILKTPSGRRAFVNARKTVQDLRKNVSKLDPELTDQLKEAGQKATGKGVGRGLKLEFLDQVKQEMFDLEQAAKSQFGKPTSKSRSISILRKDFIKELDSVDLSGNYAKARLSAGDKLANQEALEAGADFLSKSKFSFPEELGVAIKDMSPEARHLFRVGAMQSLKGKIADVVSRADASKKLIDIQSLENKIKLAFGDNVKFKQYTDLLENEKDLFRAVTDVVGNSKTAERGAALDDFALDPGRVAQGVRDIFGGRFGSAAVNLLSGAKSKLVGQQGAEDIANVLTGRNVAGLADQPLRSVQGLTAAGATRTLQESLTRALVAPSVSQLNRGELLP